MPLGVIRSIVSRRYGNFRGIDLLNPETSILPQRSPDCLNVWKSYDTEQSNIIQTREGIELEHNLYDSNDDNNTIYNIDKWGSATLVHKGKKFISISGDTATTKRTDLAESKYPDVFFNGNMYLISGNYYYLSSGTGNLVAVQGYAPTTTINRSPSRRRRALSRCQLIK